MKNVISQICAGACNSIPHIKKYRTESLVRLCISELPRARGRCCQAFRMASRSKMLSTQMIVAKKKETQCLPSCGSLLAQMKIPGKGSFVAENKGGLRFSRCHSHGTTLTHTVAMGVTIPEDTIDYKNHTFCAGQENLRRV